MIAINGHTEVAVSEESDAQVAVSEEPDIYKPSDLFQEKTISTRARRNNQNYHYPRRLNIDLKQS